VLVDEVDAFEWVWSVSDDVAEADDAFDAATCDVGEYCGESFEVCVYVGDDGERSWACAWCGRYGDRGVLFLWLENAWLNVFQGGVWRGGDFVHIEMVDDQMRQRQTVFGNGEK